jgi:hypothetical protein
LSQNLEEKTETLQVCPKRLTPPLKEPKDASSSLRPIGLSDGGEPSPSLSLPFL